jgi:hypothetical protein
MAMTLVRSGALLVQPDRYLFPRQGSGSSTSVIV